MAQTDAASSPGRALLLILLLAAGAAHAESRLTGSAAAEGLDAIYLLAGRGTAEVRGLQTDAVEVVVTLRPRDADAPGADRVSLTLARAEMKLRREGNVLRLSLPAPDGLSADDYEESWRVSLPGDLAGVVQMAAGTLSVDGLGGGLDLRMGVGDVAVEAPRGPIRAVVSLGNIHVRTASRQVGHVRLLTRVGKSRLQIAGRSVAPRPARGPGSRVFYRGPGYDHAELLADVGDILMQAVHDPEAED